MTVPLPAAAAPPAPRLRFRQLGREVLLDRSSLALHRARLRIAVGLPGAEPAQGALADLLFGCADSSQAQKAAALQMAQPRLRDAVVAAFVPYVSGLDFPRCSRLATRWSVLVAASLDVPPRALRCSADDSRRLADDAVDAWLRDDEAAQIEFLDHCWVCGDTLAFMLARRAILSQQDTLPPRWDAVCNALQHSLLTP